MDPSADTAATVANVIEVVATLIALAGLAVSFYFSWKGQVTQKEQAEAAAKAAAESNRQAQAAAQRAAAAAAVTIDELTKIADGVQALARQASPQADESRAPDGHTAPAPAPAAGSGGAATGAEGAGAGGERVQHSVASGPPDPAPHRLVEPPTAGDSPVSATAAWSLSHDSGDHYRLANTGTAIAYEVWISGSPSLDGPDGVDDGVWIAPGSSVSFTARVRPATTDSVITVTWAGEPGGEDRRSWRYPLPTPPAAHA